MLHYFPFFVVLLYLQLGTYSVTQSRLCCSSLAIAIAVAIVAVAAAVAVAVVMRTEVVALGILFRKFKSDDSVTFFEEKYDESVEKDLK